MSVSDTSDRNLSNISNISNISNLGPPPGFEGIKPKPTKPIHSHKNHSHPHPHPHRRTHLLLQEELQEPQEEDPHLFPVFPTLSIQAVNEIQNAYETMLLKELNCKMK
jgi:hypothetical protein